MAKFKVNLPGDETVYVEGDSFFVDGAPPALYIEREETDANDEETVAIFLVWNSILRLPEDEETAEVEETMTGDDTAYAELGQ